MQIAYDPNCSSCISFKDKGEEEGVTNEMYKDSMTFKNKTADGNSEMTFKEKFSG